MSFFDTDEEGVDPFELLKKRKADQAAAAAPTPTPAPIEGDFLKQFMSASQDRSAIDKARADSDRSNKVTGVIQGLATAFGGGNRNAGFYDGLRSQNAAKAKTAESDHQSKLENLLMRDKLGNQATERGRDSQEFGWKAGENDPKSALSVTARKLMADRIGVPAEQLNEMSYKQMKELYSSKSKGPSAGSFQTKAVEGPDGKIHFETFNTATGEWAPTDKKLGYKLSYDSSTGTRFSGADPTAPATAVTTPEGRPLADVRTELTGERAQVSKEGTLQAQNDQAVKEATANQGTVLDLNKKWADKYKAARAEGLPLVGGVGPIGGRISTLGHDLGISTGPNTDSVKLEMQKDFNARLKSLSGATVTDGEATRVYRTLPTGNEDPDLFARKLAEAEAEVQKIVAEKKAIAGAGKQPTKAAEVPVRGPEQSQAVLERKTKDGRTAIFDAGTKQFIRYKD